MSFRNFAQDSEERWWAGKLSFPRLLPKDTVGSKGRRGGDRGSGHPEAGLRKEGLAEGLFNQP